MSKRDGLYLAARLIERGTRARDHMWAWWPAACWRCGRRTHWVEVNYEARLCRGRCTREVDEEYFAACANRSCGSDSTTGREFREQ